MTDSLDRVLSQRFALQHDELPMPDFADVLRRAEISALSEHQIQRGAYRLWGVRPVLAAAVVVGVLACAGVAVAAGLGAFEGTPAPSEITNDLTVPEQIIDDATKQGFARAFPQADLSQAHGVIEIQTPDGPEDLWAAPNDQGGECYFIDFVNDPVSPFGHKEGSGGCSTSATSTSPIEVEGPGWTFKHPDLLTFNGIVSGSASTVQLTLRDGSTLTLPVVEHFFLGSVAKPAKSGDAKVAKVTAFAADGKQVADWTPPK